jgi:hypothetical protein
MCASVDATTILHHKANVNDEGFLFNGPLGKMRDTTDWTNIMGMMIGDERMQEDALRRILSFPFMQRSKN